LILKNDLIIFVKTNKNMHDPKTVAFEIRNPFSSSKYPDSIITIWHVDPETDGTDDSCGWFIRPRHCNQEKLKEIQKEFDFNFKHNYWFDKEGNQIFSTGGTLLNMYRAAAFVHFDYNWDKTTAFMRKYCYDILIFAENPMDCGGDDITGRWYKEDMLNKNRFEHLAGMIYADICRKLRPWYKHPKWHFWHWEIQFYPYEKLKRRYWDKCSKCGKRGFKGNAMGTWGGNEIWHQECDTNFSIEIKN